MAKAFGHTTGQQDAYAKQIDGWGGVEATAAQPDCTIPEPVLDLARQIEDAPRHLGIHSGGMVICDRPVIEVCPVECLRMSEDITATGVCPAEVVETVDCTGCLQCHTVCPDTAIEVYE